MKNEQSSPMVRMMRWLIANPKVFTGVAIIGFFFLMGLLGPLFVHGDPNALDPNSSLLPPSPQHWLGTTQTGQDVFAQMIIGSRVSLLLGFGAGFLATVLSVVIGLLAGYFGGIVDDMLSLLINIFLVLPALPLAVVLTTYFPVRGSTPVAIVILVTGWAWGARVLRSQTLSLRKREFVEAARMIGDNPWRIVFAEILPNEIAIVASSFVGTVIYAILADVGLEFLGLGDVTGVSWGNMFFWAQNNDALIQGAWWWFVAPGACVALLGAGLSLVNFGIDELANPRLRNEGRLLKKRKAVA
jgi:peptide/nickel transport system permease protein